MFFYDFCFIIPEHKTLGPNSALNHKMHLQSGFNLIMFILVCVKITNCVGRRNYGKQGETVECVTSSGAENRTERAETRGLLIGMWKWNGYVG
jgi:hypothetical protein